MGRGPGYHGSRFVATNITFGGLEAFAYIKDLDGRTLELNFGKDFFPDAESGRFVKQDISVDLFIRGKQFKGEVEAKSVVIPISFNNEDKAG